MRLAFELWIFGYVNEAQDIFSGIEKIISVDRKKQRNADIKQ